MKDLIEYYYNLVIDKLFIEDDKYHFILNNHDFYFVYFSRTKEDLEDILNVMLQVGEKHESTEKDFSIDQLEGVILRDQFFRKKNIIHPLLC